MKACLRCAGEKTVRGPNMFDRIDCPTCRGSGKFVEPDERPTLRPLPKAPDNRPTPRVLVLCPLCRGAGVTLYRSPHTQNEYNVVCALCRGEREIHPAVALEFSRRK